MISTVRTQKRSSELFLLFEIVADYMMNWPGYMLMCETGTVQLTLQMLSLMHSFIHFGFVTVKEVPQVQEWLLQVLDARSDCYNREKLTHIRKHARKGR